MKTTKPLIKFTNQLFINDLLLFSITLKPSSFKICFNEMSQFFDKNEEFLDFI